MHLKLLRKGTDSNPNTVGSINDQIQILIQLLVNEARTCQCLAAPSKTVMNIIIKQMQDFIATK